MEREEKKDLVIGIAVVAIATALGYSFYTGSKLRKFARLFDNSVERLSDITNVDVPPAVVEHAINTAVERTVRAAVVEKAKEAVNAVSKSINSQVKTAVDSSLGDLRGQVAAAVTTHVSAMDMKDFTKEVLSEAKDAIAKKFDDRLDDVVDAFKDNLTNAAAVCETISRKMHAKDDKQKMTFCMF